ncbi:hypothetical protein Metev_2355 (plasmid) [Methanohalobium evestigatum Z-7303]|uniref:Uncharacterized protein n=1 Tax=Methanohalobium evestigatum (strain ATCC BAA-1072 / DSM 3721 / NBRC 107634 / OCM 161 / Z-7303) TaxID=644295 RepID=D7EC43_METEZ|nr:hypothetical protein [Methanohalobium evestigatum]ADI75165.1 hypothetical protein Metev_2355 [Methanohalobium evestigatum Z-7303]
MFLNISVKYKTTTKPYTKVERIPTKKEFQLDFDYSDYMKLKIITTLIIALVLLGVGCSSTPNENTKNDESNQVSTEKAPQLSIGASFDTIKGNKVIKLKHQWGESITFTKEETTVKINGEKINYYLGEDTNLKKGDIYYIYYNSKSNDFMMINQKKVKNVVYSDYLASMPREVDIKIIDKNTQQFIASMKLQ